MTPEQTLNARADAVAEILTDRHPTSEHLPLAINCARNAVAAGLSAHAALQRGEDWIRGAEALTRGHVRKSLGELLCSIPGTRAHNVRESQGSATAYLYDYHTGKKLTVRVEGVQREFPALHGIDGGAA